MTTRSPSPPLAFRVLHSSLNILFRVPWARHPYPSWLKHTVQWIKFILNLMVDVDKPRRDDLSRTTLSYLTRKTLQYAV
jgi:hypothetical protein